MTCARQFRAAPPLLAVVCLVSCALAGCGKKGPPRMPLALAPARVDDLVVRRLGDDVQLQFTVPAKNTDGSTPADVTAVDVFGLTGEALDASGKPLGEAQFTAAASLVRSLVVEPPPRPAKEPQGGKAPAPPARKGLGQGDRVTVLERLTPDVRAVAPRTGARGRAVAPPAPAEASEPRMGPAPGPDERVPERWYAVAGRSRRGKLGPLSQRVAVPLGSLPPVPDAPRITYDEKHLALEWAEPSGVRKPVQAPAAEGLLVARALVAGPPADTYNVYVVSGAAGVPSPSTPANASPLSDPRFDTGEVGFGEERCFVVRTVEQHGQATVESEPSPATCVTPRDTFPPAPPRNLAAVGAEGAINLIWEGSGAADLAGYLVLRGEAKGPLEVLTPEPVRETTFRDAEVRPGVRYVYAVVAVDTAQPPNRSAESNRVEETAR